jgi:hypothetical protein
MNSVVYNSKIATINFYNIQYNFTYEQFNLILKILMIINMYHI